jgi:HAD superfamily hydrolase (TIGR01662 family)
MIDTSILPFDVLLFDLGNTLIYFDGDWGLTAARAQTRAAHALAEFGYLSNETLFAMQLGKAMQRYALERRQDMREPTARIAFLWAVQSLGIKKMTEEHLSTVIQEYYSVSEAHWKLPRETHPTLAKLRATGYRLGLISNAADAGNVHRQLEKHSLESIFELTLISAELDLRKPDKRIFRKAIEHFGASAGRALMIGDTLDADILGARNAGMDSVWLTRWANTPENRSNQRRYLPTKRIHSLRMLPAVLKRWT